MTNHDEMTAPRRSSRYRLGRDLDVSPLAWGMWRFGGDTMAASQNLIETALECGINLFDTADIYGAVTGQSEERLGHVLAQAPGLRSRMVIATKGGIDDDTPYNSSPTYLEAACDRSLRRLGIDTIDLYQIHRPDLLAHPAQVAKTLTRLVTSGKVREVGLSNFTASQVDALQHFLSFPLASVQPEFSVFETRSLEDGTLDQAMTHRLLPLAWSPLGGGRIANPTTVRDKRIVAAIDDIAETLGATRAAVALAWVLAHPSRIVPIIGSQTADRIRAASEALTVNLSARQWYDILVASRGESMP